MIWKHAYRVLKAYQFLAILVIKQYDLQLVFIVYALKNEQFQWNINDSKEFIIIITNNINVE